MMAEKIIRYIGFDDLDEFKKTIINYKIKSKDNSSYVLIEKQLPNNIDSNLINDLRTSVDDSCNIDKKQLENVLIKYNLPVSRCRHISNISDIYKLNEKNSNVNIFINFIAKMITWIKDYKEDVDYKIIYIGKIKKHEVYFLILMHLCGYFVSYFTLEESDEFLRIRNIDEYSILKKGKQHMNEEAEELYNIVDNELNNTNEDVIEKRGRLRINLERKHENNNSIKPITLADFVCELEDKKIDAFFNGFIGDDSDEEIYIQTLCRLKEYLKKQYKVIEVSNGILPLSNEEINLVNDKVKGESERIKSYAGLFRKYFNEDIEFENIIKEFSLSNKSNSVVENFTLKLLIWSIRMKDFILSPDKKAILYFGSIKTHEMYFLKLLKSLKINIVYISPEENSDDKLIKIAQLNICKGSRFFNIKEYPKKNVNEVRTSAYKAEKQVDMILHNEETGLYRPYQLNSKEISTVILRTTLEEAFILWKEEAKYRTGFVNEGDCVENPILFLKIDGVYNDIDSYYDLFLKMKSTNNTEVVCGTNIYSNIYNNQEYYGANYFFDSSGNIIVDKLKESRYYKYKYLDKDVQNAIIEKMGELIESKYLLFNQDKDFRIRVLLTILNLDEKFIKMLQSYNIGGEVPKIIFFNNNKEQYTKEDAIIIMFMVLMGVDIVILNPTGYLNIENMIDENIIPKFKLETVNYNLEIPDRIKNKQDKKSFFKRIFNI